MHLTRLVKKVREYRDVDVDGKKLTTNLRDGNKPKAQTLSTPAKAQAKHDELVAAWRAEGFRELGELDPPAITTTRNPALEAAIRTDREHDACYLVYADWLLSQGQKLGEEIVLANRNEPK